MTGPADLVRRMEAAGVLGDPAWRAAFLQVPRELFVPCYHDPDTVRADGTPGRLWRDDPDPRRRERWREGVYRDVPLATRMRDGEQLSSSSQPSLMARMLDALCVRDGMDVLEIGTGTGWTAALLAHRLGDHHVTTVDLDPVLTASAREHLAAAGRRPEVVTGDGARGCPARAPFHRILATCALASVPEAWTEQCVPDALVLLPLATGLLRLRVAGPGEATGRFGRTEVHFVPLRGGPPVPEPHVPAGLPRYAWQAESFRFLLALTAGRLPPGEAFGLWERTGHPTRERYGVTVRGGEQWAWLDAPDGVHRWPLGP
jgi:protein-L-isoaspartate O-methyltransferase